MVWHDINDVDFDSMPRCGFADASFRKVFVLEFCKHFITVLCLPIHVPEVDTNFVVVMFQFNYLFHFRCSAQRKLTLNQWEIERAEIFAARSIFYFRSTKMLRKSRQFIYTETV